MTRRLVLLALSILAVPAALTAQTAAPAAAPTGPTQRAVFHVTSGSVDDWNATVAKANDYMSSVKPGTADAEILVVGDGLKLIDKTNPAATALVVPMNKDVRVVACHASMKANHMEISQLATGIGTVPSGGRELRERKAQGWTVVEDKPAQ